MSSTVGRLDPARGSFENTRSNHPFDRSDDMPFDVQASGVYVIAATPFHPDGRLDLESATRLTDFYLERGATGLTLLGVMGEAPKLDADEAVALVRTVVKRAAKT